MGGIDSFSRAAGGGGGSRFTGAGMRLPESGSSSSYAGAPVAHPPQTEAPLPGRRDAGRRSLFQQGQVLSVTPHAAATDRASIFLRARRGGSITESGSGGWERQRPPLPYAAGERLRMVIPAIPRQLNEVL
ncbi:unnamed protein product [Eretmochelys imbricata]